MTIEATHDLGYLYELDDSPTSNVYPLRLVDDHETEDFGFSGPRHGIAELWALHNANRYNHLGLQSYLNQLLVGSEGLMTMPLYSLSTSTRAGDAVRDLVQRILEDSVSTLLSAEAIRLRSDYWSELFQDPDPQPVPPDWMERMAQVQGIEDENFQLPWSQDD